MPLLIRVVYLHVDVPSIVGGIAITHGHVVADLAPHSGGAGSVEGAAGEWGAGVCGEGAVVLR